MATTTIREVNDRQTRADFVKIPHLIYEGCTQYVPDMDSDIRELIGSGSRPSVRLQPFVAYQTDSRGREVPVGRVVGIINERANRHWNTLNVRFSLIEFIDDADVSRALLEAVERWGARYGMTTLQGPMGISDFDKEGMLVEDFQLRGSMTAIYNHEYYPRHLQQLGFTKEVDWLQIRVNIPPTVPLRYARVARYCREQMQLRVVNLTKREIRQPQTLDRIFGLLNESYKNIFGFSRLSQQQAVDFAGKYLPLIDMRLVPVVKNAGGEIVGIAITMVSLAEALQRAEGRLWPTGWLHLLRSLKWKHEDNAEMLLIAVRPDLQGLGVNALFFDSLIPVYNQMGIRWAETGPQLETNVRELTQWKPLNPEYVKRRRCFRKKIEQQEILKNNTEKKK